MFENSEFNNGDCNIAVLCKRRVEVTCPEGDWPEPVF